MWLRFLNNPVIYARPFLDFTEITSEEIDFCTDVSGKIGYGGFCGELYMFGRWPQRFLLHNKPSIEYLELFTLVAAVLAWISRFKNRKINIFCDNKSVGDMVNAMSASCKNCMVLIQIMLLKCLEENVHLRVEYVKSIDNDLADDLSRGKIESFKHKRKQFNVKPTKVSDLLWPIQKIWKY